jgi:hypothetical protein
MLMQSRSAKLPVHAHGSAYHDRIDDVGDQSVGPVNDKPIAFA